MPKGKGTYGSKRGRPPKKKLKKRRIKADTGWLVQKNDIGDRTAGTLQRAKGKKAKRKKAKRK